MMKSSEKKEGGQSTTSKRKEVYLETEFYSEVIPLLHEEQGPLGLIFCPTCKQDVVSDTISYHIFKEHIWCQQKDEHQCLRCFAKFNSEDEFAAHYYRHSGPEQIMMASYCCLICSISFKDHHEQLQHMGERHFIHSM